MMASKQRVTSARRRRFLKGALGASVAAAFTSGLPRLVSAEEAKELHILFPGGTWKDWFEQTFVTPFTEKRGTKVIWKTGLGFEPLVVAQRNRPQWDLVHESQNTSSQMGALNAVVEWKEDRIPNIKNIHPSFRYKYLVGKVHTPYGLAVNTKRIKRPIESWLDLWDPAFAGKVGFPDWVWVGEDMFHTINVVAGGDAENIDPGVAKLRELFKTNKAMVTNNVEHVKQLLISEEIWICPHFGARTVQAKDAGAPVEFVLPKEGALSWIWNTSIINNRPAQSIELAEHFVNTTLEVEKQIAFCRLSGYPPTNMELMKNLPADLRKLALSEEELEGIGKLQRKFDYMTWFAYRDRNRERWNKEILGG